MADHPDVAHFIAGSNNLLMVKSVGDVACRALNAFEYIVTYKTCTEALRLIKLIVIHLRLRMMMRRIA